MSIWNAIGKFIGGATGISSIIDAGTAVAGLISGNKSEKRQIAAQQQVNAANVAAQERINQRNIASQERINQQNLDFAQNINDIMRYDNKHAISDKKTDLQRSGYSAADPNLQGFSAATLTQPQLTAPQSIAPHVEPEYNAQMASSKLNSILGLRNAASEISLLKAQAKSQNANATGQEIDNAWKDVQNQAQLQESYARIRDLVTHGDVNVNTAKQLLVGTDKLQSEIDLLKETIQQQRFTSEHQQEEFTNRMNQLRASVNDLNASAGLKQSQKALTDVEKQIADIKKMYADVGINFDDNSIIGSLARLIHAGKSAELTHELVKMVKDIVSQLWSEGVEAGSSVLDVAGKAGKAVLGPLGTAIQLGSFHGLR